MKRLIAYIGISMLYLCNVMANSQHSVSVSAPGQVAVGERFRIVFSVDARPSAFEAPSFDGFRLLSGPSQSTSSSTQIINSQVTTSFSVSYTYILEAIAEGSFTIAPAKATVDGETRNSAPHQITVAGQAGQGSAAQPARPRQQDTPATGDVSSKDIFIRAQLSNASPYQSEQVIVTYKLYTRVPVSQYSIDKLPTFQGFWSETLSGASQSQAEVEIVDGVQYNTVELRRMALFPQRSGELRIEPLEVNAIVRLRSQQRSGSIFDDFFGGSVFGSYQNIPHTVRSNPIVMQVKPWPSQNKPASFAGLVGRYELTASVEPELLQVNDAATLSVRINGRGNLRMLEKPDIRFPLEIEAFAPNVSDNIRNEGSGISGSRSFEYVLIPRNSGNFEIPETQLAYFDPTDAQYKTLKIPSFTLEVTGRDGYAASGQSASQSVNRSDIQQISTDIRFINTRSLRLSPAGKIFYKSKLFYVFLLLPFLLFATLLIVGRRAIKLRSDERLMRNRRAEKMSQRRLRIAHSYMLNEKRVDFYDEIFRALWGYLSDKLSIPVSKLNKEEVERHLEKLSVDESVIGALNETLESAEFARFSPANSGQQMQSVYQQALAVIVALEKEIKSKSNKKI